MFNRQTMLTIYDSKNRLLHSFGSSTVPITAAAFPRWISILTRWRKNSMARAFPVAYLTRLPTSVRKAFASAPQLAIVSKPMGCTINWFSSARYLLRLRFSAASAAAPACCDLAATYDWATGATTVTSHINASPNFHGKTVYPSGRLPSPLFWPTS